MAPLPSDETRRGNDVQEPLRESIVPQQATQSSGGTSSSQGNMGPGGGWSQLKEDDTAALGVDVRPVAGSPEAGKHNDVERSSDNHIELEERERRAGSSSSAGGTKGGLVTEAMRPTDGAGDVLGEGSGDGVVQRGVREYKVYKRRFFGLVQLTLLNIIVSWGWLTFTPVAANSAAYYSVDETAINWLSTGFLFAFVVATPGTLLALQRGPKVSIIVSSSLLLVGNWIRYAGSHNKSTGGGNFGVVMFGQVLIGLSQPFVLAAPTRYSDLWFTDRGRVTASALTTLANPFGAALGQLIVPFWVNGPGDVSFAVLWVAVISTVACVPSFFIPAKPPTPVAPSSERPDIPLRESIPRILKSVEFWLVFIPFSVYVGFFNSISSLLNQIMQPYGFSDTDSGIAGAVLIVVGLVTAAITSPILDRTKKYLLAIKIAVPIIALSYLAFVWMPATRSDPGPFVILALEGASSFALLPVAVEYLVEIGHPISPEVTSTVSWAGSQLLGGIFIVISDALKAGRDANPPFNMTNALIFTAVVSLAVAPLALSIGMFGRADKASLKRTNSDQAGLRIVSTGGTA